MSPEKIKDPKNGEIFLKYQPKDKDWADYTEGLARARTYNGVEKGQTVNWVAYYNVFQRLPADLGAYRLRHPLVGVSKVDTLPAAKIEKKEGKKGHRTVVREKPVQREKVRVGLPFDGLYEEKMVKFAATDQKLAKRIVSKAVNVSDILSDDDMGNLLWGAGGPMFGAQTSPKDKTRIVNLTRAYLQSKRLPQEDHQEKLERRAEAKIFSGAQWFFQRDRIEQIKLAAILAANFLWPETNAKFGMETRRAVAKPALERNPERFLFGYDERLWQLDPALIERNIRSYDDRARVQRLATLLFKTIEGERPSRAEFDDLIVKAIGRVDVNSREFQVYFSNARAFLVVALQKGGASEDDIKKARFLEKNQVGL